MWIGRSWSTELAEFCQKGLVRLVVVSTVLCCEGRALLVVGYLFLLNLLWTVDLFFLLTKGNLSLRLVPVVLAHLLFRLRYVPG